MKNIVYLVKYGEIFTKGDNRYIFIDTLVKNIKRSIKVAGDFEVVKEQGRIVIEPKDDNYDEFKLEDKLKKVFGTIGFSKAMRFEEKDFDVITKNAIEFVKENHRWFLRIYLYSYEKDVTLDDCEKVTRSLNDFLDELIPVKYYLEVSSPGLERKFKSDKEFLIFKGRRISLKLKTPLEGETEKIFKGEILDWDDNEGLKFFRFEKGDELQIPRNNIQSAKLYID